MITEAQLAAMGVSLSEFNNLTAEEKQAVELVLDDVISNKTPKLYEELYYQDYEEIPVDFDTFLKDDYYLGKATNHGEFLYPFWREEAKRILSRTDISEVALSGSIGVGKTTAACIMMAYRLYQLMCMKDPQTFFHLSRGTQIVVAFLNNTLASSSSVGFETFQSFVKESPWFLKHGTMSGVVNPVYCPKNGFKLVIGSRPQHTLGMAVCLALLDEVSFSTGQDPVNYEKSKVMSLYTNIRRRTESRFLVQGRCYGMTFLVSSKATESSFLEAYIADRVRKGDPIYVVDQPLWKVKPYAYSGKTFKVAVGNKFLPSRILSGTPESVEEQAEAYSRQGLNVIDVPIEHKTAFEQDIEKALQDIAGISTSAVTKAFSGQKLQKCVSSFLRNPFQSEVITTGLNDNLQIRDFFTRELVPNEVIGPPVFIHLDASLRGDRTGLSAVAIIGTKNRVVYSNEDESNTPVSFDELLIQQIFTVGIQAPSDSEISLEKTRQFIYYLHDEVGLNIKKVTADGFQSADFRQILYTKGYNTGYTSLDRTPDGYDSLRSAVSDRRIIFLQGCDGLFDELTDLEKDNMTGKYDHPAHGRKDEADSLAGAHYDALQYKDEYLFFGQNEIDYEGINDSTSDIQKELDNMRKSWIQSVNPDIEKQIINFSDLSYLKDSNILFY